MSESLKTVCNVRADRDAGDGLDLRYPIRAPSQSIHMGHDTSGKRGGIAQAKKGVSSHECEAWREGHSCHDSEKSSSVGRTRELRDI